VHVTDRGTDGRTDGIGIASTVLAMRALRRAVNKLQVFYIYQIKFALDLFVVEVFRNSVSK